MRHTSSSCHSGHRRQRHRGHHDRKERVLHTRISEQLAEDIRQLADDLRVPASNLVRNVLEEVFTMVDSVSGDVGDLFDDLIAEAEGVRDRVRGQAASGRRRAGGNAHRRSRRRGVVDEADLEAELREDEGTGSSESVAGAAQPDSAASVEADASDQAGREPEGQSPRAAELFPEILGWQPLVLNRDFACGRCGRRLAAGDSAFLGIGEQGLSQTALCGRCAGRR